jgi:phospholipid/cholesterol/gamma-HCH transport system permease protein
MAAELGTMRVTEQIDALAAMGANPIHYLVVPRFLACLLLIPSLVIMADFMGVVGAGVYSIHLLGVDYHHYWENSRRFVGNFDLFVGVFKSLFFGAAIALIGCHRGFHCDPGAEGVGRAATSAFVYSFVAILLLNLLLGIMLNAVYYAIWPEAPSLLF